ncbi:Uncharacterised protein [Peptoniphilus harei]|uniref:Uncharacterized protein n=1 Tax=Peptoniphilus harei TaxID=54005 RepID=A0A2X1ZJV4_9FIRM|nr:Uncharacterised protein [Peptoniphilus harei]
MSIYDISEEGEGYNMRLKGFPKDNNERIQTSTSWPRLCNSKPAFIRCN